MLPHAVAPTRQQFFCLQSSGGAGAELWQHCVLLLATLSHAQASRRSSVPLLTSMPLLTSVPLLTSMPLLTNRVAPCWPSGTLEAGAVWHRLGVGIGCLVGACQFSLGRSQRLPLWGCGLGCLWLLMLLAGRKDLMRQVSHWTADGLIEQSRLPVATAMHSLSFLNRQAIAPLPLFIYSYGL